MNTSVIFKAVSLASLQDGDYYPATMRAIQSSQSRCWCSIFIVDHDLDNDELLRVDNLLIELSNASWRGVDVRLIVGGSRSNTRILNSALLAQARAKDLDIEVRLAAASKDNNSHVKLVIADSVVITGSHNWSSSMFGGQTQDSVLLDNTALASYLSIYFENQWLNTSKEGYDVSI